MKKDIDARKVVGTVIGIVIFVSCAFYFTYAWYQWKSGNSTVDLTIKDGSVECSSGPSVDVKNIGPVLNISDGVKTSFSVKNTGSVDTTLTLGLNITSISDSLKTESFKYALYQDTTGSNQFDYTATPLLTGNFSKMVIGNNTLSTSLTIGKNSTSSFQFVVYIDGSMPNDSSMMNSSLSSMITYGNCDSVNSSGFVPGAYVKYTGNNGCSGKACEGQNANYVSDSDMGYCFDSSTKFNVNGWRVAYSKDGTAYITSAGAPECMCTNSRGVAGTSCSDYETTAGVPKHLANLNAKALTYCNSSYAYGGKCDSSSAWNMNDTDFQNITGDTLNVAYDENSGFYDSYSLINNGGFYWFATAYSASSTSAFYWVPDDQYVGNDSSAGAYGVRPVLRLASSVKVTGGSGTYEDPYTISNEVKLSDVAPGSYVKYTGNNGCSGKSCEGQNANYVSDSDMGYCYDSNYKFNANGWRVAYSKDGTAYITSAGAPECMCTNSSGVAGTSCDSFEQTAGKHLTNLNTKALTYCNSSYAYGGKCNSSSAWNMNDNDFQNVTGDTLNVARDKDDGSYDNYSLINNGSAYWFASTYSISSATPFYWSPAFRFVDTSTSDRAIGVRPVLRLRSSVKVTGGSGTYEDPYTISNSG